MSVLPQASSRRELREREAALRTRQAGTVRRRRGRAVLSFSSMLAVVALALGASVPATLFSAAPAPAAAAERARQTVSVADQSATVSTQESLAVAAPDGFASTSRADLLAAQYAASGVTASGRGSVRWPFRGHVVVSSPYGPRSPICSGSECTDDFHHGTDFLPGDGAPITAIANGVVVGHSEGGSDLGNYVSIRHKIGRDVVVSIYGHLQAGSSPLVVGQTVKVGDFVGLVGATGIATGPHLHLGISVNGVEVDPLAWMLAHAK